MSKKKPPTIYDVAEHSGISISTISRVLNSPEMVNPETRAIVLDAIDKLRFVPKAEARARALSRTNRIGVITPFFTLPSFVQRLRGIASALTNFNYELVIYTVDSIDRLHGYLSSIPFTGHLDGLIVLSLPVQKKDVTRLLDHELQTVLIEYPDPSLNFVEIDDVLGGLMATEHLLKRGHRRVAFVGDKERHDFEIHPAKLRQNGFRQALTDHHVPILDEYVCMIENTQQDAMQAARRLLQLPTPPTAIFAASDVHALSILKVAAEMHVQVPEQLAVIGFDDIDSAEYMDLTTIRQHLDQSGKLAAEILLARIADPARPPQHVKLQLELIHRRTT